MGTSGSAVVPKTNGVAWVISALEEEIAIGSVGWGTDTSTTAASAEVASVAVGTSLFTSLVNRRGRAKTPGSRVGVPPGYGCGSGFSYPQTPDVPVY